MFTVLILVAGADPTFAVENKCPAFVVRNLCPAVAAAPARAGYPVRGSLWTHPGNVKAHLMTGVHQGKWTAEWVNSLTNLEAESLHSDDHEGRVDWRYVPGYASVPATASHPTPAVSYTPRTLGWSYCPPGGT